MSKPMNESCWEAEAKQAYELLAEKDKEITLWRRLANNRTDEAEAEIEKLHGNLNECTERGMKAEAELAKWTCKHDNIDLQTLREQADNSYSFAAHGAYINGLEHHLKHAEERGAEAERKMTNQAHNHTLDYEKLEKTRANLKTATDALKEVIIEMDKKNIWIAYNVLQEALADIEGEMPYHHSGVSSDYTGASNKEQIHEESTWRYIEKDALEAGDFGESCQAYQGNALLWLRDKITTIEDTLSDMQAELIRKRHED